MSCITVPTTTSNTLVKLHGHATNTGENVAQCLANLKYSPPVLLHSLFLQDRLHPFLLNTEFRGLTSAQSSCIWWHNSSKKKKNI